MSAKLPARKNGALLYFDCYSGISGDMILGALVDCGLDLDNFKNILSGIDLPGYRLRAEKVNRYGLTGTAVTVEVEQEGHHHRRLPDIIALLEQGSLPEAVRETSKAIFHNLAEAEAAVHGIPVDQVHFHEVGAVDSIVDVVGCAAALHLLAVGPVHCSPLPAGRGMVRSAHGLIPLPAPATLELMKSRKAPLYGSNVEMELVTPTGAAVVTTLASAFGPPPPMNVTAVGYGAGKNDPGYPNFLRVFLGEAQSGSVVYEEAVRIIEANIDDLNPEIFGYLMDKLLQEGALDVYFTPVQMKKNRPGTKLTVLAPPFKLDHLLAIVFHETSTLGVRVIEGRKVMQPRVVDTIATPWGPVRVKKVTSLAGAAPLHYAPEYEDCLAVACRTGLPLKEIYRQVESLFRKDTGDGS